MQTDEIFIKLSIKGVRIKVGHEFLDSIVRDIPDGPENLKVFEVLSTSSSKDVRSQIAWKNTTSRKIIKNLLNDPNTEVVERLVRNSNALKLMKEKEILTLIGSNDIEVIKVIASNVSDLERCDVCKIATILSKHRDPSVRYELVSYWRRNSNSATRKILKKLSKDRDIDVANAAKESLQH